jgi:hypothetical protein
VLFHNRNIQAAYNSVLTADGLHQGGLGDGVPYMGDFGHYAHVPKDAGAELGDMLGTFSYTVNNGTKDIITNGIPNFFGLKNWYHNIYGMLHGVAINGTGSQQDVYVQTKWNSDKINTNDIAGLVKVGSYANVSTNNWFYPKKMGFKNLCFWPVELGGSSSTYYTDGCYLMSAASSGLRGLLALLSAYNGAFAGSFGLSANDAPSLANGLCGAFLCEAAEDWDSDPTWVA